MRTRSQAGFTLIELLVTVGILALVMLLATQLLAQASRIQAGAQIEFAQPSADLTTRWLRRDVQGAAQLGRVAHAKTEDPLELWGNVEGMIRYEREGSDLDRVILGMQGEEIGRRTVMRDVVEWQWRAVGIGLVEVEFKYEHRLAPRSTPRGGSRAEYSVMSEKRRFALRGLPRRFW